MPPNRKYYTHGSTILISTRIESGLPLSCSYLMNYIIWGILARASELYNIRICGFVVMGNHVHFLVVVSNPAHVKKWVGYVKAELAHAVNKQTGRKKRTLWCEGYDSPHLLTSADALRYLTYIYANPSRADLEESIDKYPGVSSWEMFCNDEAEKQCKRVLRPMLEKIDGRALSINEQKREVAKLDKLLKKESTFKLEPFAWIESYPDVSTEDIPKLKQKIIEDVHLAEGEARERRELLGREVIGATTLRRQSMDKPYEPKKFSPKMICISSCKTIRERFIEHYRALCSLAAAAYEAWKKGDFSKKMPLGLYAPPAPELASALRVPL